MSPAAGAALAVPASAERIKKCFALDPELPEILQQLKGEIDDVRGKIDGHRFEHVSD